jgi:calcineurin-like phosphoesterase
MHGEITGEKRALGHTLDGRVSAVAGTHTHVPTADEEILPGGTGYVTDLGMTGPYDSVIGIKKELGIQRFTTGKKAFQVAKGNPKLYATIFHLNPETGHTESIERIQA